ncbi:MAG: hypothetical protein GPJ54_21960 [Candidatus Heimdallarchaeota archaeon]|nr:hypothetical protein [Candidatus Heimdallarchaeota archaeon]
MLIDHLNLLPCPVCKQSYTWTVDGVTHENRVVDGIVKCGNGHSWKVTQEILRLDKENSSEDIIYSDREKTGYPKEVSEQERLTFLEFLDGYFGSLQFGSDCVIVSGESILFYRYLKDSSNQYITTYEDEGVLRQLHETAVRKRTHETHSFVRSEAVVTSESANQLIVFPKMRIKSKLENSLIIQFIPLSAESNGKIIWTGEKYKLEELSNLT